MVVFVTVTSVVVSLAAEQLPAPVATDALTSKPLAGQEAPAALVHTTDTVEFDRTAMQQKTCARGSFFYQPMIMMTNVLSWAQVIEGKGHHIRDCTLIGTGVP